MLADRTDETTRHSSQVMDAQRKKSQSILKFSWSDWMTGIVRRKAMCFDAMRWRTQETESSRREKRVSAIVGWLDWFGMVYGGWKGKELCWRCCLENKLFLFVKVKVSFVDSIPLHWLTFWLCIHDEYIHFSSLFLFMMKQMNVWRRLYDTNNCVVIRFFLFLLLLLLLFFSTLFKSQS